MILRPSIFTGLSSRLDSPLATCARSLLSAAKDPPLDVTERPCTLVVAEDEGLYESSFQPLFDDSIPRNYGIPTRSLKISSKKFDEALQELKSDLSGSTDPSIVLLARGPCMSWLAQFYLESLPLAGLILVDPLPWDDRNGANQMELYYEKYQLRDSLGYQLFQDYSEHWGHWTLQLEPGVVPMLVWHTITRPAFKRCADNTAHYHSTSNTRVPVLKLPNDVADHCEHAEEVAATWTLDEVL